MASAAGYDAARRLCRTRRSGRDRREKAVGFRAAIVFCGLGKSNWVVARGSFCSDCRKWLARSCSFSAVSVAFRLPSIMMAVICICVGTGVLPLFLPKKHSERRWRARGWRWTGRRRGQRSGKDPAISGSQRSGGRTDGDMHMEMVIAGCNPAKLAGRTSCRGAWVVRGGRVRCGCCSRPSMRAS